MATRKPSLRNQIDHALRSIFRPGESRHAAKAAGEDVKYIFSYGTLDRYREACEALVNILPREERPKWLKDFTEHHIERGLELLRERGNTDKTIKTQLNAWRKMGYALNHLGWSQRDPHSLVPERFYSGLESSRPQGPVSQRQIEQWRELVSKQAEHSQQYGADLVRMFDLCRTTGMRIEECARLQEELIDREAGVIHIRKNIAKNGRERDIPLNTVEARQAVAAIPTGRHWLWTDGPALARRLQDIMRETAIEIGIDGKRGPHRLRAAYAEAFIEQRMSEGLSEREARLELTRLLGHGRIQVTYSYCPRLT